MGEQKHTTFIDPITGRTSTSPYRVPLHSKEDSCLEVVDDVEDGMPVVFARLWQRNEATVHVGSTLSHVTYWTTSDEYVRMVDRGDALRWARSTTTPRGD